MRKRLSLLVGILGIALVPVLLQAQGAGRFGLIYKSKNLSGHSIAADGSGSSCPYIPEDASIASFDTYGEVTSNPREVSVWVNAIGYKRFVENLPNGQPIGLGKYRYSGRFRLPALPAPDPNRRDNAENIRLRIQLWDGRNELFQSRKS